MKGEMGGQMLGQMLFDCLQVPSLLLLLPRDAMHSAVLIIINLYVHLSHSFTVPTCLGSWFLHRIWQQHDSSFFGVNFRLHILAA